MSLSRSPFSTVRKKSVVALCAAAIAVSALVAVRPAHTGAANPIAYPDLVSLIPSTEMRITHPSPNTKEFDYTHIAFNAGLGPLEVQPTNYDPSTNLATGVQNLYSIDASGNRTLAQQHTAVDQFFFHVAHNHYHFPLETFGLYTVNPDGSVGDAVAVSPKNGFCLGDDLHLDASLAHSPATVGYNGGTCPQPLAVRGISSGWGDHYDRADPGQSIDITGVPDGTYWFHSVIDPDNNFLESNESDNTTDIKVRISGDTVTPVNPLLSQGSFVFDQSFFVDGVGNLSTPAFNTSAPNELLVAFVSARSSVPTQTATVSGGGLTWTLARRTNTQAGTAEVWTAMATAQLSNAVISSSLSATGYQQSLSVYAIQGAAGIGATASASGATGGPGLSLTTTTPDSWVMAVGDTPNVSVPHVPAPGITMVHQDVDVINQSTSWVEAPSGPTAAAGTQVNFADSYPTGLPWNETAIELLPFDSGDTTPPVISTPTVSDIGPDRATVNWTTNEVSTSRVDYGTTPTFGQSTPTDPALVLNHSKLILGLSPSTTYQFQVASTDFASNTATSGPFTFTTTPPRTTPPVFTNVRVTDMEPDQVTIGWTTDEVADSRVEYGVTAAHGTITPNDPALVKSHFVLITNLKPSTVYHFQVDGTDPYGNTGGSADTTFQTPAIPPLISTDATVFKDGHGALTSPAFNTTAPGDLIVAFVGSDGPAGGQQTTTVTGGGLTWTLARRANENPGTAEAWYATAPTALTNATVTSTQGTGTYDQSLTVVALKGAASVGSTAAASALSGAPSVSLSTVGPNSLLYAVGSDYDSAKARTLASDQTMVHQFLDTATGDAYWTQALTGDGGPVDSQITLADTAPTTDRWNLAGIEVVRPISVPPPPPTAPVISGVAVANVTSSGATVTWTTDQVATSQVLFGTTASYGSATTLDPVGVLTHTKAITGLNPSTTYHFAATSVNGAGPATSGDFTFTTASASGVSDQTISFAPITAKTLA
ncbi:MAG TPA: lysyl oxidase family protein, partial [Acidimicrobiia bacterium]|nr:lysyl oxidase family protein [Acidimicrobiia bacterium]